MAAKKPTPEKKAPITRAQVDGRIAGLPDACERAKKELLDIQARCEYVLSSSGMITPDQSAELATMRINTGEALGILNGVRKSADSFRRFQPTKKDDLSLF
jgi:hypothetical protein